MAWVVTERRVTHCSAKSTRICKILFDDTLRIRLSEVGSFIRIQILLSVILTFERSSEEVKSWWRADIKRPRTGIRVPGGCEVKIICGERCSAICGHNPGSML